MKMMCKRSEEGAAMLVVMLVLLMTTATAVFALHATTTEMRGSGFAVQAMQTEYIAEASLGGVMAKIDAEHGPSALESLAHQNMKDRLAEGKPAIDISRYGAPMINGQEGYTFWQQALEIGGVTPVTGDAVGRRSYQPWTRVDAYDFVEVACPGVGYTVGGKKKNAMCCRRITLTARGRTRVPGDYRTTGSVDDRDYHEGASDARVYVIAGPVADCN